MTGINIVFFDLDDTLCGYWEASKLALRQTFERYAPEGYSSEEMVEHWAAAFREFSPRLKQTDWYASYLRKGEPTRVEQMRLTLARIGVPDAALAKQLSDGYADARNANLKLFPETTQVLDTLQARFPLGLITNGPADVQRQEIETLRIGHYFPHVYIEGEMGKGKPLPEVFHMIADEVGQEPGRILFVGNSYAHDIHPALLAGWHAVWIRRESDVPPSSRGRSSTVEQRPEGSPEPDATVSDLRELLALLNLDQIPNES